MEYLKSFPVMKSVNIKDIYPGCSDEGIDLLKKMLIFNPATRITIDTALDHPYFEEVKDKNQEVDYKSSLKMSFDKEGDMNVKRLRELFLKEISNYKK